MLRGKYLKNSGQARLFFALSKRLEVCLTWYKMYYDHPTIRSRMIRQATHICLQQFREDIINSIKNDVKPDHFERARQGVNPQCKEYFDTIMQKEPYLVKGNKLQSGYKNLDKLATFLFAFDDGLERKHQAGKAFRSLVKRTTLGISLAPNSFFNTLVFKLIIREILYKYYQILLYPNNESLT